MKYLRKTFPFHYPDLTCTTSLQKKLAWGFPLLLAREATSSEKRNDIFDAPAQQRTSAAVIVKMEWSENIGMNGLSLSKFLGDKDSCAVLKGSLSPIVLTLATVYCPAPKRGLCRTPQINRTKGAVDSKSREISASLPLENKSEEPVFLEFSKISLKWPIMLQLIQ